MGYAQGKFGIEYSPGRSGGERPWLAWVLVAVLLAAAVLTCVAVVGRIRAGRAEGGGGAGPQTAAPASAQGGKAAETAPAPAGPQPEQPSAGETAIQLADAWKRPPKVRNLLMRLEKDEQTGDVEKTISTIEQLRAIPGDLAADLDDRLARRLGELNMRRLFEIKSALWVAEVVAKRGDAASRIAKEHGSTFASLVKLNGKANVERLLIGQKLFVMNHPRFTLVIHKRLRTADLSLNGKFFKRYDLASGVSGEKGSYEAPARLRQFFAERGISLKPADRAELEMLLPAGTAVIVSEL